MPYPTDPYESIWNELFEPKEEKDTYFEEERTKEKHYEEKYENRNISDN
ncbi:hypothetical protein [uncultured Dysgonomonas sp.]|uniref:Uncharacterized protein n=1 Tax=uncultured Dysgonomonas sp. TaxID=206096 RepID=A0A212IX21_9BACT|nr:hypothetical protein [uncultured Dysgonomonas sp.]SBV91719.1 hypothetical protein KL86DYS1_10413 [uncultured Dysgonomonas sp.]